jgi:hypothetical protein
VSLRGGRILPTKQSPGSKGDCFGLETASSPRNDTTWLDLSSYFVKTVIKGVRHNFSGKEVDIQGKKDWLHIL